MMRRTGSTQIVWFAGQELRCHVRGNGPICIAHPSGPGRQVDSLRMPLVERELTMVYLDPSGKADAVRDSVMSIGHLDAVADHFADGSVFVLGHGSGGYAAQDFAVRRPSRVKGLILYATAASADLLQSITAPTMVLSGAKDDEFGPAAAERLHSAIPGSGMAVFEESGRYAHQDEADRFAHLVVEFSRRAATGMWNSPSPRPGKTRNRDPWW